MKFLLINHYAGSPEHGMEFRPFHFAREWVRMGHEAAVVAATHSHLRRTQPGVRHGYYKENVCGVPYIWLKTPSYQDNGARRALNILTFVAQLLRHKDRIIREELPDVVIASSTYPLDVIAAHAIAKSASAILVYEVHDLWPLSPIELGGMSPSHPFIRVMQWAEAFAYSRADQVISILPNTLDYMCSHGLSPSRWAYVPNGVEKPCADGTRVVDVVEGASHLSDVEEFKIAGKFVMAYAGAHGIANGLDQVLDAAYELAAAPVQFVMIGDGPEKERLRREAETRGLHNIIFLPQLPRLVLLTVLERMDALLLCLKPSPLFRFGISPNKLMDYMLCGRPIIHAVPGAESLVEKAQCGVTCWASGGRAIAAAVRTLASASDTVRAEMGRRGRQYVLTHHTYEVLARSFVRIIEDRRKAGTMSAHAVV